MSYLTINGIDARVSLRTPPTKSQDIIGAGVTRAQSGAARNNFNAKKWHIKAKTVLLTQAYALFLRALLDGLGDHWTFDTDAYSDKAQGWVGQPTMPTGVSIVAATPTPKRGAGALQIDANAAHSIVYSLDPLTDGWTILVWFSLAAAAFDRWVITGTGTVASGGAVTAAWKNGVLQSAVMPAWCAIDASANTITLKGQVAGTDTFDDLVVIPEVTTVEFFTSLDTFFNTQAWPAPYPALQCGGDFHPSTLSMMGQPGDETGSVAVVNGALADTAEELALELLQV